MDYGILIELVKSCTFIYDKTHKDFKNKSVRVKAWKTISRIMEFPREDVETAWTNLRNRYATEKRKRSNNPPNLATIPEWRYFRDLSFLDPYIVPRKFCNISGKKERTLPNIDLITEISILNNLENHVSPKTEDVNQNSEDSELSSPSSGSIYNISSPLPVLSSTPLKKRKSKPSLETPNCNTHPSLVRLMKEEKDDDESILFGKWLGLRLSKIKSKKARISVQKQICALMETVISSDED